MTKQTKPTGGEQLGGLLRKLFGDGQIYLLPPFVKRVIGETNDEYNNLRYVGQAINHDDLIKSILDWHNEKLTGAKREVIIEIKKYLLTMRQSITNQSSYSSIDGRCLYCGDISGEQYNEAIDDMEEKLDELSGEEVGG